MKKKFLDELRNKCVLVLGFARSGYKTAQVLNELGVSVILTASDDLTNDDKANELKKSGVKIVSGSHPIELLDKVDLIVKNPGIKYSINFLQEAIKRNIEIITEVELSYLLFNSNIVAITGTNGKTTTTTLIYEILKLENSDIKLAGNIGYPTIEVAYENENNSTIVMELSSFQLNGTNKFKPHIAIITNLDESHLDYHGTIEEYHFMKKKIFANQDENDYLILNIDHKKYYSNDKIKSKIIYYSTKHNENADVYVKNNFVIYKNEKIFDITKVKLPGEHNLENSINATIVGLLNNVDINNIREVLYNFSGVKHRLQFVGEIKGVKYYNDSKSTNAVSTVKALGGFDKNVILICGGKERGVDFSGIFEEKEKLKYVICIGETKEKLYSLAKNKNLNVIKANKVSDATELANEISECGDIILLSPACASWDQYKNFEERGEEFLNIYEKIKNRRVD